MQVHWVSLPLVLHYLINSCTFAESADTCHDEGASPESSCPVSRKSPLRPKKYVLYDVNAGEGFNLRRDVYMRVARLVHQLNEGSKTAEWVLVLPPWGPLYHWRTKDFGFQAKIPWKKFFDVESLAAYVPVIEFEDYLKDVGPSIDKVYYLQHHPSTFMSSTWEEKYEEDSCQDETDYFKEAQEGFSGWFWGYHNTLAKQFTCLSVQGTGSTLKPLLLKHLNDTAIMLDRAEVILHDVFGDAVYWEIRRSMRFSKDLRELADAFRREVLDSEDERDGTVLEPDWRKTRRGTAVGGPFLAVHLRRQDYLSSRPKDVPDLRWAAEQIQALLDRLKLTKVFVATDGTADEFQTLRSYIPGAVRYETSLETKKKLKDGGLAIIDQWIAAHARYFVGTYESTFSFRIQEEREILGFDAETTFNRLCGDGQKTCVQPTKWRITYE